MNINECCCQLMSLAIEGEKTREGERERETKNNEDGKCEGNKRREEQTSEWTRGRRGEASGSSISIHMACSSGED